MNFETNVPVKKQQTPQAWMQCDMRMLAKMLHLPQDVLIVSLRPDPTNAHMCIIELSSPRFGENGGEYQPAYSYEHTTIIKLTSLDKVGGDDE